MDINESDEIFRKLYKIFDDMDDSDFVEDKVQMYKFLQLAQVMEEISAYNEVSMKPIELRPKNMGGSITITLDTLLISDELFKKFVKVLQFASVIEITPKLDGTADFRVGVSNIFKFKPNSDK